MTIEVERRGDAAIVTAHGAIAEVEAHRLERELLSQIDQGAVKIVVDLSDVPFITSAGLAAFMLAHKRVRGQGGGVRLVGTQPLVRHIIEVTKLTKLFTLHDSVGEALPDV